MKATSLEKRVQIVEAKMRKEKTETIILWTKVSKSTIDKVWKRFLETGSAAAYPHTGRESKITPEIESKIRAKIAEKNDISLEEMIDELKLPIKKSQLSKLTIAWGLSFKKRRSTPKINNARMFKKSAKSSKNINQI